MRETCRRGTAGLFAGPSLTTLVLTATLGFGACSGAGNDQAGTGGKAVGSGGNGSGGVGPAGTGGVPSGSGGAGFGGIGSGGLTPGTGGMASTTSGGNGGGTTSSGSGGIAGSGATGGRLATGGATSSGGTTPGTGGMGAGGGPPIVDLFNGTDLTGWTANRESAKRDQSVTPGTVLSATDALAIFKVENGTIRTYGDAIQGSNQWRHTLVTTKSYSHYNFWLDYKWGTKKFAPYADVTVYPRDAGILFHLHRDLTQVWPSSIEFQIKDGTVGDIFALLARCNSLALNGGTMFVDSSAGGTSKLVDGSTGNKQHMRSNAFPNLEIPNDWNSVQLQVNGGAAVYIVNGHIVNRVLSVSDTAGAPVTSGPIALQAEHAEVFYRNIRIQVLP